MIKKYTLFIWCLLCFAISCKTTQPVIVERPNWVDRSPSSTLNYIGIGVVNKNLPNFRVAAQKQALDAIASEVSVTISSESVLKTTENSNSFEQEFRQNIQINSDKYLEGYELMDSFEDEQFFYVYYSLSRQKYADLKAQRFQEAIKNALGFYQEALVYANQGATRFAMVNFTKSMEAIVEYLDQNIIVTLNGSSAVLPLEIVRSMNETEQSVQIISSFNHHNFALGQNLKNTDIQFFVLNSLKSPLANYPVILSYKNQFNQQFSGSTNAEGMYSPGITKIRSEQKNQEIELSLNTREIIEQTSKNRIVRNLLINHLNTQKSLMLLTVSLPKIFVVNYEQLPLVILNGLKNAIISNRFDYTENSSEADLRLTFTMQESIPQTNQVGLGFSVNINANILFQDVNQQILFSESIPTQRGTQATVDIAQNVAYQNLINQVQTRLIPQFSGRYYN